MIGTNSSYACFHCRIRVRRPRWGKKDSTCHCCGGEVHLIDGGSVPRKDDKKGWQKLRARVEAWDRECAERDYVNQVSSGARVEYEKRLLERKMKRGELRTWSKSGYRLCYRPDFVPINF